MDINKIDYGMELKRKVQKLEFKKQFLETAFKLDVTQLMIEKGFREPNIPNTLSIKDIKECGMYEDFKQMISTGIVEVTKQISSVKKEIEKL